MKKYFFTENEAVNDSNCARALNFAIQLKKSDSEVGRIVVMIATKNQLPILEAFFPDGSGHINVNGFEIPVVTLRTYRPFTVSVGGKDILITLRLDPDQFAKFEDKFSIKYLIHIPWDMSISGEWIRSHNAVDINTGTSAQITVEIDPWVKGAIGWLKATSFPNSGFHHPLDENRLKVAANALKSLKAKIERESIIAYCLSLSIKMESAMKIVDYFNRAQTRAFPLRSSNEYTLDFLKSQWADR